MKKNIFLLLNTILFAITSFAQAPKNLTLLDSLVIPGQTIAGCWHYNNSSGNEYALLGAQNGIIIVDITNPLNPVQLFQLPGVSNLWHEVKVQGDYAYAVSEGIDAGGVMNGLQIINLSFLPDSAPYKFYYGDSIIAGQLLTGHSVTTAGHYVYINGHNISSLGRGVLILDITDPWNPVYTGAITTRYCHDSYVRGDTIYTSDITDGMFTVYDITNRSNPVILATQMTPLQFNHNTWLSDDGHTIFTTDEKHNAPLGSYDITDLNNITLLDTFFNANFSSFEVHNVRVKNDFLITPSYGSQLTLVDAAYPMNLIEIGNYTTGNSLCWDADPYLNSGNIIATDMNNGTLFIFSPTYQRACYLEGTVTDSVTGLTIPNATVQILVAGVTDATNFSGVYYTGYADSGNYIVEYSKSGYITRQISVSLQNGILVTLNVKLVPTGSGINNIDFNTVSIFPNPVNDFVQVSPGDFKISEWMLSDESGREVLKSLPGADYTGKFSIDTRTLPKGVYTLVLQNHQKKIVKSFLKQ